MSEIKEHTSGECNKMMLPIKDALDVLSGKWKLPIITALLFGTRRFKELSRQINGITDKMLSKELKELEQHQLISRTVYDRYPPVVEYSITEHGRSLIHVLEELEKWGSSTAKKLWEELRKFQ